MSRATYKNEAKPYAEVRVQSVSDFIKFIERENRTLWVYRGHRDADWELKPSLHRARVRPFQLALGTRTPEVQMLKDFKRAVRLYLSVEPADDWEWLSLAQHHGLLTRLLDWTENPLVALFFSVERANDGRDSAVWCSQPWFQRPNPEQSPFTIGEIMLLRPPHITPRITVQKGLFTVHPVPSPPLDEWSGTLIKVIVPENKRVSIRMKLEELGVDRGALFPDLDGIAAGINRRATLHESDEFGDDDVLFDAGPD